MVDLIKIEKGVEENLNDAGLAKEGETWLVYKVLFHLFVTDEIVRKMTKYQLDNAKYWYGRVFKAVFVRKLLRETKRTKKYRLPPAPPTMVKETKETTETYIHKKINQKSLGEKEIRDIVKAKRDLFWSEISQYSDTYKISTLERFLAHWGAPVNGTTTLLYETKSFSLPSRLRSWSKSAQELDAQAAEIRLERTKAKQAKTAQQVVNTAQQDAIAKKRAADNAQREEEIDKAKEEHVSYAEYQRLQQEKESADALPQQEASQTPNLDNPKTVL